MIDAAQLGAEFGRHFDGRPAFYRAPGRVNLIGEHTDYNDGFVMPAALQFDTRIGIAPHSGARLRVRSREFDETVEIPLDDSDALKSTLGRGHWSDYVIGVVIALQNRGMMLGGADILVGSDIPLGAGLSSSASFEVAVAFALLDSNGLSLDKMALAQLCQHAENDHVGTRCGIMDQFAAAFGLKNHALALDCRTLDHRPVPLGSDKSIIVCNTLVRHAHAGGEYNQRRADCESAVLQLSRRIPGLRSLRDVSMAELIDQEPHLDPVAWRRARHIVSENLRVTRAVDALQRGDAPEFGHLMYSSHHSLRDDFEVSCPELDLLVELAGNIDGVHGARMTGGGFGGCTVNWVQADAAAHFIEAVGPRYAAVTGYAPEIYICAAADGVSRINE